MLRIAIENSKANDSKEKVNEVTEARYREYRQMCLAKHGNPVLQKQFGYRQDGMNIVTENGPDTSEKSIRIFHFVFEQSIALILLAINVFYRNHAPCEDGNIVKRINEITITYSKIRDENLKRWGTEDPFEGKW